MKARPSEPAKTSTEPGQGVLRFERSGERTVLARASARAPLKLLEPNNHGSAKWVFTSTFGGGIVAGDTIALDVEVADGAEALLGTQASTKVYRATTVASNQRLDASVGEGALLVVLPDALVPFADARYQQASHFRMGRDGSIAVLDILSAGRIGHGERWAFSHYENRTRVERDGMLILDDSLMLGSQDRNIARVMRRFDALATFFVFGRHLAATRTKILESDLGSPGKRSVLVASASPLGDDGACLRVAAESLEPLLDFVRTMLAPLRERLGDDPFARKW